VDLALTEDQEMLRSVARQFLQKECPEALVRRLEEERQPYSAPLWAKMAQLGWLGLALPEQYGGNGGGLQDLTVLLEEFGRATVPGPFVSTAVHVGRAIALGGTEQQKQEHLPEIAAGRMIGCLAFVEHAGRYSPDSVSLVATPVDAGHVLNGTKLFVENARIADRMVVVARCPSRGQAITLFLIDPKTPGIDISHQNALTAVDYSEIRFADAYIPDSAILGGQADGASVLGEIQRWATVAECAYIVGLLQQDMEATLEYLKIRTQFGQSIGAFQVLQHKAADMAVDVDGCRLITQRAAWAQDTGAADAAYFASVTKAFVSDASQRVVAHGQQMHGAIGFTREHKLQLYFRRQKAAELRWGDGDFHRETLADLLAL
jgi:alkylation response protein AidB-like acyl-CoA dehydrogenase